ncbi:MAG: PAS domain S-box protein [Bacteroidales bacterium]|nr:PAS domain S-box protein [Bacteroidales bacterium]
MMPCFKYGLSIFFVILIVTAIGQNEDEQFVQLSVNDGLSSSVVTCILKDSRGFMWFGTQYGLNRYDAYEFTTYFRNDSVAGNLSGNFILTIYEDNDSVLWIGTDKTGLNRYDRRKDCFVQYLHQEQVATSLSGNTVYDILETTRGELLFATDKGISVLNRQTENFYPFDLPGGDFDLNQTSVLDLYEDTDKSLWFGTDQGLIHYDPAKNQIDVFTYDPDNPKTISNNSVNQILRSGNGVLMIATNEGVNAYHEQNQNFTRFYYDAGSPDSRAKSEIQAMAEDNRGNRWFGSFGGGLIKAGGDGTQPKVFTSEPDNTHSLSSDYINALYFDETGILWIGTYGGGINMIQQVRIRFDQISHERNNRNSLAGKEVYAIYTEDNYRWFGTEKGISISNKQNGDFYHLQSQSSVPNSLSGNVVYCIERDSAGVYWAGTAGNGLNRIEVVDISQQKFIITHYNHSKRNKNEINSNEVFALLADNEGILWVGTNQGISLIKDHAVVDGFHHEPGNSASLSSDEINTFYMDRENRIWIGTYNGLNLYNRSDSSFTRFDSIPVLGSSTIYSITETNDGTLWIGTDNAGVVRFNPRFPNNLKTYTKSDGLPDNVVYCIIPDEENNLWMSSNNGIFKVILQRDSQKITVVSYNSDNWLETDAYNIGACHQDENGMIYFGSFDGATMFMPENVRGNTQVPPVYITGFELFFKPVQVSSDGSTPLSSTISETREIVLKHDQNVLKFEFTALNFIEPDKNRFAFMMDGLENSWNYTENQREAQYLYLPPGEYRFRVKAANNDGLWNHEGTWLDIIIKPPFTETIWFYLLLLSSLIMLVLWIMHVRTKRLRTIRNQLEEQVQKRTFELRETNTSLEAEIQERLKVEEALKKSEARFRQLIETMNEGFSVQDKEGRITYVNPRLCEMFGRTPEEIIGHFPTDFIDTSDPENLEKLKRNRDENIHTTQVASYEITWKHKNGQVFESMVSPKAIIDPVEGYTGSVAVLTDITDLKNAENELISKNKALNSALNDLRKTQAQLIDSEKMASLGQLTAGVAHEINNPINFVSGNVQPLRRDIQDVLEVLKQYDKIIETLKLEDNFEKIRELKAEIDFEFVLQEINHLLDGIGEGAQRTAEIVKGLRNFSRMDEHELKIADINQGIESTLLILHNKLKQTIEVVKDYGDIPDIMCYPGQLNQVFMNVINNAVESIEGEGKITIKTRMEKNRILISVKDSGKGIPDKVRKKIFDPFYTTKEVGKGTGLGLSISFGIVEKHNGTIEVKSKPGEGSEFIIAIPVDLK